MTDDGESVYVVAVGGGGGGRNNVHTESDCHYVERAKHVYKKPREVVDDDRLCRVCAGEFTPAQNTSTNTNATRKTLSSLSPADAGLSPLGERNSQGGDSA